MASTYHHGNLRAAILAAAEEAIAETGPDGLSLRDLARRAEVSHAAPAHHFGDKRGLLTTLATSGFTGLADQLQAALDGPGFHASAVAYVRFALSRPGCYRIMFRTDLLDAADAELQAAKDRAARSLGDGVASLEPDQIAVRGRAPRVAAWGLVHGIADLALSGAIDPDDALSLTEGAAIQLFATGR